MTTVDKVKVTTTVVVAIVTVTITVWVGIVKANHSRTSRPEIPARFKVGIHLDYENGVEAAHHK